MNRMVKHKKVVDAIILFTFITSIFIWYIYMLNVTTGAVLPAQTPVTGDPVYGITNPLPLLFGWHLFQTNMTDTFLQNIKNQAHYVVMFLIYNYYF